MRTLTRTLLFCVLFSIAAAFSAAQTNPSSPPPITAGGRFEWAIMNTINLPSFGAVWGEDPRYFRTQGQPFSQRVGHVVKMTFMASDRDGRIVPAYARYAAITGSNALSNAWRADSDVSFDRTAIRIGFGFLGRMTSNAFFEFWPDVKDRFWKHE